jgi:hypothetical protein
MSLVLKLTNGSSVEFKPADKAEFFAHSIHDGVLFIEYARAKTGCPNHHNMVEECHMNCGIEYAYPWTRIYPLTSIVEIAKSKV